MAKQGQRTSIGEGNTHQIVDAFAQFIDIQRVCHGQGCSGAVSEGAYMAEYP